VAGSAADLLVDTGNGLAPLRPFVARLRRDADKPLLAVATHAHMDHVCGLREFDDRLLHPAEAADAAAPDRLLVEDEIWPGARAQMAEAGYPVAAIGIQASPRRGFDPRGFDPPGVTATRLVEEGDRIDLGTARSRSPPPRSHARLDRPVGRRADAVLRRRRLRGRSADRHRADVGRRATSNDGSSPRSPGPRRACRPRRELRREVLIERCGLVAPRD
jgi:hypothetical protein